VRETEGERKREGEGGEEYCNSSLASVLSFRLFCFSSFLNPLLFPLSHSLTRSHSSFLLLSLSLSFSPSLRLSFSDFCSFSCLCSLFLTSSLLRVLIRSSLWDFPYRFSTLAFGCRIMFRRENQSWSL